MTRLTMEMLLVEAGEKQRDLAPRGVHVPGCVLGGRFIASHEMHYVIRGSKMKYEGLKETKRAQRDTKSPKGSDEHHISHKKLPSDKPSTGSKGSQRSLQNM